MVVAEVGGEVEGVVGVLLVGQLQLAGRHDGAGLGRDAIGAPLVLRGQRVDEVAEAGLVEVDAQPVVLLARPSDGYLVVADLAHLHRVVDLARAVPHVEDEMELALAVGVDADVDEAVGVVDAAGREGLAGLVPLLLCPGAEGGVAEESRVVLLVLQEVVGEGLGDDLCLVVDVVVARFVGLDVHLADDVALILDGLEEVDASDEVAVAVEVAVDGGVVAVHPDGEVLIAAEESCGQRVAGADEGAVEGCVVRLDAVAGVLILLWCDGQLDHHEGQLLGLAASEDGVLVGGVAVEAELEVALQLLCEVLRLVGVVVEEGVVGVEREYDAVVVLQRVHAHDAVEGVDEGQACGRRGAIEGAVDVVEPDGIGVDGGMSPGGGVVGEERPSVAVVVEHASVVGHPLVGTVGGVDVEDVVLLHLASGQCRSDGAAEDDGCQVLLDNLCNHNC